MAKRHLRLFKTQSDYETFYKSSDFAKPNISYIEDVENVYFHELVEKPRVETPTVKLTFNATEDNLLAFNNVSHNVKTISIDGSIFDFTPMTKTESVGYITHETFINNNIPPEAIMPETMTEYIIETIDDKQEFTEDSIMAIWVNGYGIYSSAPLGEGIAMGFFTYNDSHKLIIPGRNSSPSIALVFYTSTNELIETKNTYVNYSGGLVSPLTFETPGIHDMTLVMNDNVFHSLEELSSSTV